MSNSVGLNPVKCGRFLVGLDAVGTFRDLNELGGGVGLFGGLASYENGVLSKALIGDFNWMATIDHGGMTSISTGLTGVFAFGKEGAGRFFGLNIMERIDLTEYNVVDSEGRLLEKRSGVTFDIGAGLSFIVAQKLSDDPNPSPTFIMLINAAYTVGLTHSNSGHFGETHGPWVSLMVGMSF